MRARRFAITVAMLVTGVIPAAAQTEATVGAPAPTVETSSRPETDFVFFAGHGNDPADVLNRLWSFDVDGDDRLSRDELPERMQALLTRADQDGDGVLNSDEVVKAVKEALTADHNDSGSITIKTIALASVVSDLRLPQPKRERALALVKNYAIPPELNNPRSLAEYDLLGRLRELLDAEEYENFSAAATRMKNVHFVIRTPPRVQ